MNFDFENYVVPPLKGLAVLLLGTVIAGTLFLQFFPTVFGGVASALLGPLASFFATHTLIYKAAQVMLLYVYTLLAVAGIDFVFLFLFYILLDKIVTKQATYKDLAGVALRSLWALIGWQFIAGVVVCVSLCWNDNFSVLWLVPPFLSESIVNSMYMMVWEITLLVFAFGFAFSESRAEALKNGWNLLLYYMPLWMVVFSVGLLMTWAPALLVGENTPSWVLLLWGLCNHTVLFVLLLIFLFNRRELFEDEEQDPQ
jgi:hypothetical protein